MAKRRVYELAKDYGMKGPEFVQVLKDLGFTKAKTHMAVLDDADQMVIEVRLDAAGFAKASAGAVAVKTDTKKPIRKKSPIKKKIEKKAKEPEEEEAKPSLPFKKKAAISKKVEAEAPEQDAVPPATGPSEPEHDGEVDSPDAELDSAAAAASAAAASGAAASGAGAPAATTEDLSSSEGAAATASNVGISDEEAPADSSTQSPPQAEEGESASIGGQAGSDTALGSDAIASSDTLLDADSGAGGDTDAASDGEAASDDRGAEEVADPGAETSAPGAAPAPLTRQAIQRDPDAAEPSEAASTEEAPAPQQIRRMPPPEKRAKILGKIELPKETISDATRRSAPGGARNPASVDRNLRRAAMDQFRSRGAQRGPGGVRRGPMGGPGAGRSFPGFRAGARGGRGGRGAGSRKRRDPLAPPPGVDPEKLVQVEAPVSVKRLSEALGHRVQELLVVLLRLGVSANINAYLDKDQVELVALELSRNVEVIEERQAEDELLTSLTEVSDKVSDEHSDTRPPIVTFMGHVDHGKTTLLDALRDSQVTKSEAGGITQHVGAYKVSLGSNTIVILDTPGHAAFTQMRARGAQLTDIVVLVVAADDGVMPQTEEALNHAKAAEVPVVVAINKIDKAGANPMRIQQQLATLGLQPEEWGGQTQFIEVSALKGTGLEDLVEKIGLEAMVLELEANPEKPATGTVIEAKQTPAQGNVISVVVLDGTLHRGDLVLCGSGTGRVRVMHDDHGKAIDEATPGTPVEILGLPELPAPGDKFYVVKDQKMAKEAKEVAGQRLSKQRNLTLAERSRAKLMDLKSQLAAQKVEEVRLIVKADVMGSLEPIKTSLEELSTDEVRVRILHSALGGISETDVALADASDAVIVGFNSVPDEKARQRADQLGVQVRFYNVIYELIDDCRLLMEGLLSPEQREEIRGHAEIRRVFKSSKFGSIAGSFVLDGKIGRNNRARLVRDGTVVHTGKISGLRRDKDDAREVKESFECGILLENYNDIKVGDVIEAYRIIEIKRTLGDSKDSKEG